MCTEKEWDKQDYSNTRLSEGRKRNIKGNENSIGVETVTNNLENAAKIEQTR